MELEFSSGFLLGSIRCIDFSFEIFRNDIKKKKKKKKWRKIKLEKIKFSREIYR